MAQLALDRATGAACRGLPTEGAGGGWIRPAEGAVTDDASAAAATGILRITTTVGGGTGGALGAVAGAGAVAAFPCPVDGPALTL